MVKGCFHKELRTLVGAIELSKKHIILDGQVLRASLGMDDA
jgi:hypothetical protein